MPKTSPSGWLIFEFPNGSFGSIEDLQRYEARLVRTVGKLAEIDGHEFGGGGAAISFRTNRPEPAFESCKSILAGKGQNVRVTFRNEDEEDRIVLLPFK